MLSDSLNTNQVKDASGTEVEFSLKSRGIDKAEWKAVLEGPSLPHRIGIAHQEIGEGIKKRCRSRLGTTKTVMSTVDATLPVGIQVYTVVDAPIGALTATTEIANTIAEHISLLASTGADTTIKFDCSGNGAAVLLNRTL